MKTKTNMIVLSLCSAVIGSVLTFGLSFGINKEKQVEQIIKSVEEVTITESETINKSINKLYDAVVVIENYVNNNVVSGGTGFVYKTDDKYGYIITNNHVVEGSDKVIVINSKDEEVEANIMGTDMYSDLAVLRIEKDKVIMSATLGKSQNMKLGDNVFTIGTPVSTEYKGTVTKGIISGVNRMVSVTLNNMSDYVMNLMQTDAAINPGNSGGPLANINGEVIGINSMKLVKDEIEGIGFAIPIDDAMKIIEKLEVGEKLVKPLLGATLIDFSESYTLYQYGIMLDPKSPVGVVLADVVKDSPAANAKLKKGDVILKIDGEKTSNRATLRYELYKHNVGDKIKVTYFRDGKEKEVEVNLNKAFEN